MKYLVRFFLSLLILAVTSGSLLAQKHYVVEVDRLTGSQKYFRMDLVSGRPVEKLISKPTLELKDLLTIRLINFNELIYGLEVDDDVKRKKNITGQLMANPLYSSLTLTPTVTQLMSILSDGPPSRGESEDALTVNTARKNYMSVLTKIKLIEDQLAIAYDEGATLSEIKKTVREVSSKYDPKAIEKDLEGLKKDISQLKETDNAPLLEEISEGIDEIEERSEDDYLHPQYSCRKLRKVVDAVDFIQEKTIIVGEDEDEDYQYEKFIANIKIYKRAAAITASDYNFAKPYEFNGYNGKKDGDFLRQNILVTMRMRDLKRPYWTLGVHRINIPSDTYTYDYEYDYFTDSIMFIGSKVGGGRTVIGTAINFPLPIKSEVVSTSLSLGIAMAFSNEPNRKAYELNSNQAFITTGIGFTPAKFSMLSLRLGAAWAKFQHLSGGYRTNVSYDSFSIEDPDALITKKVKPCFQFGLCVRL
jgi:hypothetical protein